VAHILLAEDINDLRILMRRFLESVGHTILEAEDGRQALRLAMLYPVDLFISDLFMPEVDGIEAISHFSRAQPGVPIIATSGGSAYGGTLSVLGAAKHLGADRILQKPFGRDALLAVVGELLDKAQRG